MVTMFSIIICLFLIDDAANAETAPAATPTTAAKPPTGGPQLADPSKTELGPEDKPAFPHAPAGFDEVRKDIPHGELSHLTYHSTSIGIDRNMMVYLPPNYSKDKKYPVLYLLHGYGSNEYTWPYAGAAFTILDNLYAEKKIVPMVVVFPDGCAMAHEKSDGTKIDQNADGYWKFEDDFFKDVIPYVESHYSVKTGAENRALAGLSMGGFQTVTFGLKHLDMFTYLGSFSGIPQPKRLEELLTDPNDVNKKLKFFWVSVGDKDWGLNTVLSSHQYLKSHNVKHLWHLDSGPHDFPVWRNDLYHFSQMIFKSPKHKYFLGIRM